MPDLACASDRATPSHVQKTVSVQLLRDRIAAGVTLTAIAAETGISRSKLRRLCLAAGIELLGRPGPKRRLPSNVEMVELIERGITPTEIARAAGVNPAGVYLSLYAVGLRIENNRIYKKEI